ncbi:acyl carrier protein [Methylobacterium sp. Leaf399]|uniref:acyl carrier protein n=1 Tax=unclassified Methylobacterium TaxID=2615210 RepID=UPI0006FCD96A|nr:MULTISPECIES: acyl carrier protein [unclassified Methylobacterium]KQP51398.1 acyl carrier protein [Methylobacterium sp. Leaf108]KQT07468.1 acyl carrier protein [Methylobacterium sp. Leaf399]KQT77328.1 acyl carrier protein [Methylobacterium sp. Leaf466]
MAVLSPSEAAVREAILAFVASRNPGIAPGAVTGATSLVTSDVLDSIGVLDLLMELGERFDVPVDEESFALPNFESVDALARSIDGRRVRA